MPDQDRDRWDEGDRSWLAYRRVILEGIDNLNRRLDDIERTLRDVEIQIAVMRTKVTLFASLTGGIGGMLASTLTLIIVHYLVGSH